ncbi:hypothetical protein ASPNIDRAFT_35642 [Aspergillus niger ATCC 1015]|uniref:Uncharacterized protein n=1 Tax=Aspergillus niger (strain ATCC 1015 / CBS 113.46 / FGSC A1144 / LSHB Ac4 / NCTC 3858a / NRRL 328 / USDA 3528.7) TaxID=380704 RepID=G3XQY1_ASPNA|nr:hypothetical protein ASPNIDRAFT_35642 [Aspergillus niger ATCC 1015]
MTYIHSLPPSSWTATLRISAGLDTSAQQEAEKTRQISNDDGTLNIPQNSLHSLPPSSWTVTHKISEKSSAYTQEEAEEWCQFPLAHARFECENVEDSNEKAILRVFMEIPCVDTNCPAAPQGTYGTPNCVRIAVGAHKLLALHNAKYSPKLIQYMEVPQTENRRFFLPGGKIYYMVYNKLPGVPLGNGLISYTEDGRAFEEGLFWRLPRVERDRIRAAFQVAYLYIQGKFEPLDLRDIAPTLYYKLDDYGPKVLAIWGLAIAPKGEVEYNVPIAGLEQKGWLL